ncbi:hypothetical protein [Peterkaempfera bronchialis]
MPGGHLLRGLGCGALHPAEVGRAGPEALAGWAEPVRGSAVRAPA